VLSCLGSMTNPSPPGSAISWWRGLGIILWSKAFEVVSSTYCLGHPTMEVYSACQFKLFRLGFWNPYLGISPIWWIFLDGKGIGSTLAVVSWACTLKGLEISAASHLVMYECLCCWVTYDVKEIKKLFHESPPLVGLLFRNAYFLDWK
jgi:hypothetical protein